MRFQLLERGFILASLPFLSPEEIAKYLNKSEDDIKEEIKSLKELAKNHDPSSQFKKLFVKDQMDVWLKGKRKNRFQKKNNLAGFRDDLQKFFRSKMEANIARVLSLKYPGKWEYESEWFPLTQNKKGKGGNYLPDFIIRKDDGTIDFAIEVKGYFFPGDKSKLKKMITEHPHIRIVLMTKRTSKQVIDLAAKFNLEVWLYEDLCDQYASKVNWE